MKHHVRYKRRWVNDLSHPRLNKDSRYKNPKGGRVYEHILVMEEHLGRYVTKEECVHHIDGDKLNNDIDNLYLCESSSHHSSLHSKMEQFFFSLIREGIVSFDKEAETFHINRKDK